MAQFKKGKEKTGGRLPGSPNHIGKGLKNDIDTFLQGEMTPEKLTELFKDLKSWQKLAGYKILLPYVLPRMQSHELDINSMTDEMARDILNTLASNTHNPHENDSN